MEEIINYDLKGIVFNTQRFSVHDGPGIRTILFLKGCPLSCKWCSNPESQTLNPNVMFNAKECIKCGRCMSVCKYGAISPENRALVDRTKCKACGECVAVCPTGALDMAGKWVTVAETIKDLKKDASAFRRSDGGVTFSGGEALVQHEFLVEMSRACHSYGWTTALETTGFASEEIIEKVFPHIDYTLMDIKCMDPEKHKKFCGIDNTVILKNAKRIGELSKVTVRVPVIPGFNYTEEDIDAIASFAKTIPNVEMVHLLPYHALASEKYEHLGRDYEMSKEGLSWASLKGMEEIVLSKGLQCLIGG